MTRDEAEEIKEVQGEYRDALWFAFPMRSWTSA